MRIILSILKWLGIGVLAIIVLLLGFIFIPPWFAVMQDESSSEPYVTYLEENNFVVEGEEPDLSFRKASTITRFSCSRKSMVTLPHKTLIFSCCAI